MDPQIQMDPQEKVPWDDARHADLAKYWKTKMTRAEIAKLMGTSPGRIRQEARKKSLPRRRTNGQGVR